MILKNSTWTSSKTSCISVMTLCLKPLMKGSWVLMLQRDPYVLCECYLEPMSRWFEFCGSKSPRLLMISHLVSKRTMWWKIVPVYENILASAKQDGSHVKFWWQWDVTLEFRMNRSSTAAVTSTFSLLSFQLRSSCQSVCLSTRSRLKILTNS